jgi:hypothetical protein
MLFAYSKPLACLIVIAEKEKIIKEKDEIILYLQRALEKATEAPITDKE